MLSMHSMSDSVYQQAYHSKLYMLKSAVKNVARRQWVIGQHALSRNLFVLDSRKLSIMRWLSGQTLTTV